MTPAVECNDVFVNLGGQTILNGPSLTVSTGEWLSIIGPNGAGKSTLLRAIAGLLEFDGSIEVFGSPVRDATNRERSTAVAFVPQTQTIPLGMSAFDYVLLGRNPWLAPLGRESSSDLTIAEDALARLDVGHLTDRVVDTLSGGERQRVVIARALTQQTPLILLDEPTTSLDIGHQQSLLELLDDLRSTEQVTLITTMHDLTLAGHYADRLMLLSEGTVVADGSASTVLTSDNIDRYYNASVRVMTDDDGSVIVTPVRRYSPKETP